MTQPTPRETPMSNEAVTALERRVLRWSMVATASLAVLGVVWGMLSGSSVVLFDGVYGILGVALTWLAIVASRLVAGGPTEKYPFGREALAPMVITLQGIALLGTCLYASIDAVMVIVDGGSDVSAGSALAYGLVSAVTATVVWLWLRGPARHSDLLRAEATQWLAGTALSVAVIVAFAVVIVLDRADLGRAGAYIDPALVLLSCAVLIPTPIRMIRETLVELLEGAPGSRGPAPGAARGERGTRPVRSRRPLPPHVEDGPEALRRGRLPRARAGTGTSPTRTRSAGRSSTAWCTSPTTCGSTSS